MATTKFSKTRETFFLALADATRLRILNLLSYGEVCVTFFTEVLGDSQPKISRHLAYLRSAGLVSTRRDGKWMFYSIEWPDEQSLASVLKATLEDLKGDPDLTADRSHLIRLMETGLPVNGKAKRKNFRADRKEKRSEIIQREELGRQILEGRREEEDIDTFLL